MKQAVYLIDHTQVDVRVDFFRPYLGVTVITDGEIQDTQMTDEDDVVWDHEHYNPDDALSEQVQATYIYQTLIQFGNKKVTRGIRAVDLTQLEKVGVLLLRPFVRRIVRMWI